MPYTIPRSHTIHTSSRVARRSADHLPTMKSVFSIGGEHRQPIGSERDSPESAPATTESLDDKTAISPPPFEPVTDAMPVMSPSEKVEPTSYESPQSVMIPGSSENSSEQLVTSGLPLDVSSFHTSNGAPTTNYIPLQDQHPAEAFFSSPDADLSMSAAAFNAPPVDWSSFPFFSSDMPTAPSTQAPSYVSFDFSNASHGINAPSSSGDLSELDEVGPLPGFGSANEASDFDQLCAGPPGSDFTQPQILPSDNVESPSIDDFLKSANDSTAALEQQQLQQLEVMKKQLMLQGQYEAQVAESFGGMPMAMPMATATSPADAVWAAGLFNAGKSFFPSQTWA